MTKKYTFTVFAVVLLILLSLGSGVIYQLYKHNDVHTAGEAMIGGAFTLVDTKGKEVKDTDFRGKLMLVFFGFTHCPDMCPTGLGIMTEVMNQLGKAGKGLAPIFITVDPERDTKEQIAEYLTHFHPSIIGLTGTQEQVKKAENVYRVYSNKMPSKTEGDYMMDHSGILYLMGKDGKLLTFFQYNAKPEAIVAAVKEAL